MASNHPLEKAFRKSALDRLMSPEKLDGLLEVTKPRGWLAVLALLAILIAAIFWATSSMIPIRVPAQGVLLRGQGVSLVEAPGEGIIHSIEVTPGQLVKRGEVVAFIRQMGNIAPIPVLAPIAGQVLEVRINPGNYATGGTAIASIEPASGEITALVYVSSVQAKEMSKGMRTLMALEGFPVEEFGYLIGSVQDINSFPSTRDGMLRVLGSEELVAAQAGDGPQTEVRIALMPDPETPSGFTWTASNGPSSPLRSGTLLSARITLRQIHPLDFIIRPNTVDQGN
jgi:multidrug efflux pump subunit AcrA (membrane-fusion protein)